MGNTVDVNENEFAIFSVSAQPEAVRKLEAAFVGGGLHPASNAFND
jgi:hypothetical protein